MKFEPEVPTTSWPQHYSSVPLSNRRDQPVNLLAEEAAMKAAMYLEYAIAEDENTHC